MQLELFSQLIKKEAADLNGQLFETATQLTNSTKRTNVGKANTSEYKTHHLIVQIGGVDVRRISELSKATDVFYAPKEMEIKPMSKADCQWFLNRKIIGAIRLKKKHNRIVYADGQV